MYYEKKKTMGLPWHNFLGNNIVISLWMIWIKKHFLWFHCPPFSLFILTNSFYFLYLACIAHPPPLSLCFDSRTVAGIKTAHRSFSFMKRLLSSNVQTHSTESFLQFCSCQMLFRSVMHSNVCPVYTREHWKIQNNSFWNIS